MSFNFIDKTEIEADIIANVLQSENIMFKTKRRYIHAYYDGDNDDFELQNPIIIPIYTITAFTTIEHFEFVKKITEDRMQNIKRLNKCFYESEFYDEESFADTRSQHKSFLLWVQTCYKNLLKWIKQT